MLNVDYDTNSKGVMSTNFEDIDSSLHVSQCSSDTQTTNSYISNNSDHRRSSFGMKGDTKVKVMWFCLKKLLFFCFN